MSQNTMPDHRSIFVVHGRNAPLRDAMFSFLRAVDLKPLEWEEAKSLVEEPNPYIGTILEQAFAKVSAILVLFSPDDEAKLRDGLISDSDEDYEKHLTPQARPNVLFEAGMAFGFNPQKTILVEIGKLRPFSDIYGRHTVRLDNTSEKKMHLIDALRKAGLKPVIEGRSAYLRVNFTLDDPVKLDETKSGKISRMNDEALMDAVSNEKPDTILKVFKKTIEQTRPKHIWFELVDMLAKNAPYLKRALIYLLTEEHFGHVAYDRAMRVLAQNNQEEFYDFMKELYNINQDLFHDALGKNLFREKTYIKKMDSYTRRKKKQSIGPV